MKKIIIIVLCLLFIVVFAFLQYNLVVLGHDAFSSPSNGVIGAVFDIILGVVLCVIAKLISEKRARVRNVVRFLGQWTVAGGILFFLISIIRIIVEK